MDAATTYERAGLTVTLYYDTDAENPHKDRDTPVTIVQLDGHRPRSGDWGDDRATFEGERECPRCDGYREDPERYELIRGHWLAKVVGAGSWDSMDAEAARDPELSARRASCLQCKGDGSVPATLGEYIAEEYGAGAVWVALRHWDDWRPALRVTDDAEPDGFAVITGEDAAREWPGDPDAARAYLLADIGEYSQWMSGEVFGYVLTGPDGEDLPGFAADSCWGFVGEKYAVESANEAADDAAARLAAEAAEAAAMAARDIITV